MGALLAVALAVFLTAHLALVGGLLSRRQWLRGAAALALPPLAPWWGWQDGMRARTFTWLGALAAYAALVFLLP